MNTYEECKNLANKIGTPFYLFNRDMFLATYNDLDKAFRERYKKFIIGYSYKTNYIPYICKLIKNNGGYAEVVSRLEYDLALKIGQNPQKIIFNGPVKSYEDIELAIKNRSIINIDSWYEIEYVNHIAKKNREIPINVGIRINLQLHDQSGMSHIQEGLEVGRFGFSINSSGVEEAIKLLRKIQNVEINCLHGHTSTSSRSVWVYENITQTLCDIACEYLRDSIKYIDVGGGIYGKVPPQMDFGKTPTFDDYAEAICGVVNSHKWSRETLPHLILEPGVSMVANALNFVTKVIDVKKVHGKNFVLVDGSVYNINPNMHKKAYPFEVLNKNHTDKKKSYSVVGYTCMEKDYLLKDVTIPEISIGDYININNVGAYTIVLFPPFINVEPPIVVKDELEYRIIRKKQAFEEFFSNYTFSRNESIT